MADLSQVEKEIRLLPWSFKEPVGLWERHAQPGQLPTDNISWNDCQEWLKRLNRWLSSEWSTLGGMGQCPKLTLPSESQWESACRAESATPFHFGDTLDPSWANYYGESQYGLGRQGLDRSRPVPVGFFGLVNRWGLAELHGQLYEWCGDQWHPDPTGEGWPSDGQPWQGVESALEALGTAQKESRLLRGGSWIVVPRFCRAAYRFSSSPANFNPNYGVRPCCLLPLGSLLGA